MSRDQRDIVGAALLLAPNRIPTLPSLFATTTVTSRPSSRGHVPARATLGDLAVVA